LLPDKTFLDNYNGWLVIFSRAEISDWDAVGKREWLSVGEKRIEVV